MLSHAEARAVNLAAWRTVIPTRNPTLAEIQAAQAVELTETAYGSGWRSPPHPPEANSAHNWGAMQGTGPAGSFTTIDTHPNPDGTSTPYRATFKAYVDDVQGAADVISWLERHGIFTAVRQTPTVWTLSATMRRAGYYEGFGATEQDRIANHATAITRSLELITRGLGEPYGLSPSSTPAPGGATPLPFPERPREPDPSPRNGDRDLADRLLALREAVGAIRDDLSTRLDDVDRELAALELRASGGGEGAGSG